MYFQIFNTLSVSTFNILKNCIIFQSDYLNSYLDFTVSIIGVKEIYPVFGKTNILIEMFLIETFLCFL